MRLCRVQFLAEDLRSPVRYRLRGFAQFAADELRHYAVATAMRGVVVHDQIIGMVTNLWKVVRGFRIGSDYARNRYRLAASTHAHQNPPHIQIRIFGGYKENLGICLLYTSPSPRDTR